MEVVLVRTKNSTVTFDTATKLLAVQVDGGQIQEVPFELTSDDMELMTAKYLEILPKVVESPKAENPTFDDFLKAKKVRVVYDTRSPKYDGTIQNVKAIQYNEDGMVIDFPDTKDMMAYLGKREYKGNGVFKDKTLTNREVKLEIIE